MLSKTKNKRKPPLPSQVSQNLNHPKIDFFIKRGGGKTGAAEAGDGDGLDGVVLHSAVDGDLHDEDAELIVAVAEPCKNNSRELEGEPRVRG